LGLPVSEVLGCENDLLNIVFGKARGFDTLLSVGKPFFVGVLQVAR
jgi:hypothetical protein